MKKVYLLIITFLLTACASKDRTEKAYEVFGPLLTNYEYPYPVKQFQFSSQNQDLHMAYMDLRPPLGKAKETIVLLHGKNFSGFYWEAIAKELLNMNYRVVIPDQIGFGKSSKPMSYQHSFGQFSLNTNKLLKSLKIKKYTLVGHSMGGMLAITKAYLYPSEVSRLILINPIGLENYLDYAEFKDPEFFYSIEKNKTPEKAKAYQKKNYYDGKWKAEYDKLLRPFNGQMKSKKWPLIAWNNALTYGPIFNENMADRIQKLKTPTTLILGTRDRTGPGRGWRRDKSNYKLGQYQNFSEKFKKLQPKAKVYTLDNLGHMPQFEAPERFSKVFYPLFK